MRFIYARDESGLIGRSDGRLPWRRQKGDKQVYKNAIMNSELWAGRKTGEVLKRLGYKKLKIISRNPGLGNSLEYVIKNAKFDDYILGGAEIYKALEEYATTVLETVIHNDFPRKDGDAVYKFNPEGFTLMNSFYHESSADDEYPWTLNFWTKIANKD